MIELQMIMPAYNEEAVIARVVRKWAEALRREGVQFNLIVLNDGSKDGTLAELRKITDIPELIVVDKPNSGHGPSILKGYRMSTAPWVMQMDSDEEVSTNEFATLWRKRNNHDFLLGQRVGRENLFSRNIVSWVSRIVVWTLYGRSIYDVNSFYRLMRAEKFRPVFNAIPSDTFAPNVMITGFAAANKFRVFEIPVKFTPRTSGEVSIKKFKLFKAAFRSLLQTIAFRFNG